MPQSLARVVLHVVFITKNRVPFLKDLELRARLHAYAAGVLQTIGCEPILIGGVEDHVHILCNLSRTVTIAGGKARFQAADADKDGKVTPWEFRAQHWQ